MDKFEKMILSHVDARVEAVRYMITDYEYDEGEGINIWQVKDYINQLKEAKIMLKGIKKYGDLKAIRQTYKMVYGRKPRA